MLLAMVTTQEDLIKLVKRICVGEEKIQYNNNLAYVIGMIAALLCAYLVFSNKTGNLHTGAWVGGAVAAGCFLLVKSRYSKLSKLTKEITLRSLSLKYGFSINVVLPYALENMADLQRGNYSRDIDTETQGTYQGALHELPYYFCHLHYVDKTENGRDKTPTYTHYDRYYLFIHFPWVKGISVKWSAKLHHDWSAKVHH